MNKIIDLMYKKFTEECSLIKSNEEYKKLDKSLKVIERQLNESINIEQKNLLNKFSDTMTALSAIEARECYSQGVDDGINILSNTISSN